MASTLLNEPGWSGDAIERQLAHGEKNGARAVYNYAQYLPEREKMMQAWANYLDHLRHQSTSNRWLGLPTAETDQSQLEDVRNWLGPVRVMLRTGDLSRSETQK